MDGSAGTTRKTLDDQEMIAGARSEFYELDPRDAIAPLKPLNFPLDADLGSGVDFPANGPRPSKRVWSDRAARLAKFSDLVAIALFAAMSISLWTARRERTTPHRQVNVARKHDSTGRSVNSSFASVARASLRSAPAPRPSGGATAVSPQRRNASPIAVVSAPGQRRYLGIDEEPILSADARLGMKVSRVYPGTAAEAAGLRIGDVLRSANGYLTEQRGNLAWIIAYATPLSRLDLVVTTARDGRDHAITARLSNVSRVAAVRTSRGADSCACATALAYDQNRPAVIRTVVYRPHPGASALAMVNAHAAAIYGAPASSPNVRFFRSKW